jgi:hypothetical protein
VALLGPPAAARADFQVKIDDGAGDTVTLNSNGSFSTTGSVTLGTVSTSASEIFLGAGTTIGAFTLTGAGAEFDAQTNAGAAGASAGRLSNSNIDVINTGAGSASLTVAVSATGYMAPSPTGELMGNFGGNVVTNTGSVSGNVTITDGANSLFGAGTSVTGSFGPATGAITGVNLPMTDVSLSTPYSMSIVSNYSFSSGAELQVLGISALTVVPEPSSWALLLSGAPVGLGFWLRRRRALA